jgi:hypothetical protein
MRAAADVNGYPSKTEEGRSSAVVDLSFQRFHSHFQTILFSAIQPSQLGQPLKTIKANG